MAGSFLAFLAAGFLALGSLGSPAALRFLGGVLVGVMLAASPPSVAAADCLLIRILWMREGWNKEFRRDRKEMLRECNRKSIAQNFVGW